MWIVSMGAGVILCVIVIFKVMASRNQLDIYNESENEVEDMRNKDKYDLRTPQQIMFQKVNTINKTLKTFKAIILVALAISALLGVYYSVNTAEMPEALQAYNIFK